MSTITIAHTSPYETSMHANATTLLSSLDTPMFVIVITFISPYKASIFALTSVHKLLMHVAST